MEARLGPGRSNASANRAETAAFGLERSAADLLTGAGRTQRLSGRSHDRVLKIARTLADLDGVALIDEGQIAGALQLRRRAAL
jgi:magnesium chelatase family protein